MTGARSSTRGCTSRIAVPDAERARLVLDVLQAAGIERAVLPPVRAIEVDELTSREVQLEDSLRFVIDLFPRLFGDRSVPTLQQVVAHRFPFQAANSQ